MQELEKDDVIVKVNGFIVNGEGLIKDPVFKGSKERVPFVYTVMCAMLHESNPYLNYEVVRMIGDKPVRLQIKHKCQYSTDIVPKYVCNKSNEFFIFG